MAEMIGSKTGTHNNAMLKSPEDFFLFYISFAWPITQ